MWKRRKATILDHVSEIVRPKCIFTSCQSNYQHSYICYQMQDLLFILTGNANASIHIQICHTCELWLSGDHSFLQLAAFTLIMRLCRGFSWSIIMVGSPHSEHISEQVSLLYCEVIEFLQLIFRKSTYFPPFTFCDRQRTVGNRLHGYANVLQHFVSETDAMPYTRTQRVRTDG